MSGHKIQSVMFLALLGAVLLVYDDRRETIVNEKNRGYNTVMGITMIGLAAFTEAVIYFLVRDIKTTNNWNHIFISYFLGALILSCYFINDIQIMKLNGRLSMSLGINSLIGLIGYLLRFYAVSRLDTILYASLSYFGIVMSFVYGVFIGGDSIDLKKVVGACLIIFSNMWLYLL
jgi:drug/metabolite transporter (DMT)-like permease